MASARIVAEPVRGAPVAAPEIATLDLATYEEDAARARGKASGVARPSSEAEVAALLELARRSGRSIVAQGARSSLTAGATPRDDLVVSLERLDGTIEVRREGERGVARVEPGVSLRRLNEVAAEQGLWFPPVPTYDLCSAGGAVSTNAAGAATFKHGTVRVWVRALRLLLATGEALAVRRGEVRADASGFTLERKAGNQRIPLPAYRTPPLKKIACGYHSADQMDLIDLLIGSEGTLGVVTEVELELAPAPASVLAGLAFFQDEARALAFTADVRAASEAGWRERDRRAIDARSLELIDAASFELVRERGRSVEGISPPRGSCAILFELELPEASADPLALEPVARLNVLLERYGAEEVLVALPDDAPRRRALERVREVVPETVNELVAERKRQDPGVKKVAGDMVVPFERLPEMLARYREAFARRGLACAIWGHASDGNLHPNVLARSSAEAKLGEEALLELGESARALGGAPLSEHGVGKSPLKQELLRRFYGDAALEDMARTKLAFDPRALLAPGNIFPRSVLETVRGAKA